MIRLYILINCMRFALRASRSIHRQWSAGRSFGVISLGWGEERHVARVVAAVEETIAAERAAIEEECNRFGLVLPFARK